jgi:hypothetical protein
MMVDAGFADTDDLGDIRVTEAVVATVRDQRSRAGKDFFGSRTKVAHASCLPFGR